MQNAWRFIDDEISSGARHAKADPPADLAPRPTTNKAAEKNPGALRAAGRSRMSPTDPRGNGQQSIAWLADPSHRDEAIELLVKVARSSIEDAEPQRDSRPGAKSVSVAS